MNPLWIVWILSIGVLLMIVMAVRLLINPVMLIIAGNRVEATVIGITEKTLISKNNRQQIHQTPTFEFYTTTGDKITVEGKINHAAIIPRIGDIITLAYRRSKPTQAKVVSWTEVPLIPFGILISAVSIVVVCWASLILISRQNALDDPLHLFSFLIFRYQLTPIRLPALFMLAALTFGSLLYSFTLAHKVFLLNTKGTRTIGTVLSNTNNPKFLNYTNTFSRYFVYISFNAGSDLNLIVRRSLIKPFTRLKEGDKIGIIHPQRQPHKCFVNVWDELYLNPAIFLLFAVGFFILFNWALYSKTF